MALQKALLEVPFATGLQQKQDSRLLQVGAATSLTNGVVDKHGAVSKRPGTTAVATAAVSPWGNQVFTTPGRQRLYKNQGGGTGLLSSGRAWAYSPTHAAWTDIDYVSTLTGTVTGIASPVVACTSYDVAYGAGYVAVVYALTGGEAYLVLQDATSGAVVYGPAQVRAGVGIVPSYVRVLIQGGYAVVVYQDGGALANIYGRAFDLSGAGFTWGAETLLVADHDATAARFDVHAVGGSTTQWVLAYNQTTGGGQARLRVQLYTSPLTAGTAGSFQPPAGFGTGSTIYGITAHATSGEQIWIAYSTLDNALANNSQRVIGLNPTTLAVTTADFQVWSQVGNQVVRLGIERLTSTTFVLCGAIRSGDMNHRQCGTGGVTGTGPHVTLGWHPASKPFTIDGRVCVLAVQNELVTGVRPTYVVVDLNPTDLVTTDYVRPLATISPRIASTGVPAMLLLPSAAQVSTIRTLTVGSSIRSGADNIGVDLISVDAPYNTHQIASLGGVNYVAGGVPSSLTGQRVSEIGFLEQPSQLVGTATVGGGMAVATYNYLAVYEWIDEVTGQRIQSAPTQSAPTATVGVNLQMTVSGTCLHLTTKTDQEKSSIVGIAIYRTAPSVSTGVYYRLFGGAIPATAQNSQGASQFSYLDNSTDAVISANESYNTSQLAPGCPPSFGTIIAHGNRLVGASGTDVWFSKLGDGGTSQPQFSDSLVVQCLEGGIVTALASMDGQLVIFKRDAIYVIAGDGPDNNGGGNSWSDPRKVASDVGCTSDWRSVLAMPQGVIFQSEKKLHILTRSLEVQYFSQPVEDELAAMPVVQAIALHSRRDEVRVCLRAAEGGSGATQGATLNWNYVTSMWSKFDYYDTGNAHAGAMWESCAAIDGVFWYASTIITQTENTNLTATGAYLDGATWVTLSLETAWCKAAGVQGWGRFWYAHVSGFRGSPHDLAMSIGTDYELAYNQANTFTALAQSTWSTYLEEAETQISRQKASAIRVRLSDATPTGVASTTGAGPTLLGIQLEVGIYSGGKRLPPAQGA